MWKYLVLRDTAKFPPPSFPSKRRKDDISIVSYNMNGLPCHNKPLSEVEKYLLHYDIILLQECYTNIFNSKYYFLNRMNKYYYIYTDSHSICSAKLESSGMAILSRFPIIDTDFKSFRGLQGMDQLTDKGVMKATILVRGEYIDIYNTHFQDDDVTSPKFCLHQMKQFVAPIQHPTVIGGDFNMENANLGGNFIRSKIPTWKDRRYDYFIVYNIDVKESDVCMFNGISDHNAVCITI